MIIDFKELEEKENKHFKGGEKEVYFKTYDDGMNKIMYGRLIPSASIGFHKHESNSEIIYVLKGKGYFKYQKDNEVVIERIEEGMCHYCKKNESHSFVNDSNEDILFFSIVCNQ